MRDDPGRQNWLVERRWTLLHVTVIDVYRVHERTVATAAWAQGFAPGQ